MHCQLYLSGQVVASPETGRTKNDKEWVRLLLETMLVREVREGEFQSESAILPVSCFSREAAAVKHLGRGDPLVVGAHLYGTKFEGDGGIKYGVKIVADTVFLAAGATISNPLKEVVR